MTPFEILDHTADIGFRARGVTVEELFQNAALALESIGCDISQVEPRHVYPIAAGGEDWESLLVAWLNEVLYYLDGEQVVLCRFELDRISPQELMGRAWGEPREADRHPPKLVIKGVTYHQLSVSSEGGEWVAQVFLDV